MAGQMVHVEIPAGDTGKAREFWGGLFGWEFQAYEGSPTEYHMARFSDSQGGAITADDGSTKGPRVYFDVDDINAGVARVKELGGEIERRHGRPQHGLVRDLLRHPGQFVRPLADRPVGLDVVSAAKGHVLGTVPGTCPERRSRPARKAVALSSAA